ncbi:hypothetical protein [Spongiactinospora sp. TRM90649]|uniref:hypothetical protein n=1 Tax=Spongiactinospora sp. TRM90649 TaxID=3031114 RepID=UPI0023F90BB8|nr:hypothetical protein [Spongiactinospora sp. TRM90649]MDF5752207.1 hypothetical protein [Spongiactinospora sp. TRM90649]
MRVTVVIGPGLTGDPGLMEEIAGRELARPGASGRVVAVGDASGLRARLNAAAIDTSAALVALPGRSRPSGA